MKELQMKMTTKSVRLWRTVQGWLHNPGFAHLVGSMRFLLLGFLLSGATFFASPMPMGCALIATTTSPVFGLAGLLGSSIGYLYFWGFGGGLEMLTLGILVFATVCTLGNGEMAKSNWFMPLLTACMAAMVGLIFLIQSPLSVALFLQYGWKVCATGGLVYALRMAKKRQKSGYTMVVLGCCVAGCHSLGIYDGLTVGHLLALTICGSALGTAVALPLSALLGLVLDWATGQTFQMTALLVLAALLCQLPGFQRRPLGQLVLATMTTATVFFAQDPILALVPGVAVAVCISLLIPQSLFAEWGPGRTLGATKRQMAGMSAVFAHLSAVLQSAPVRPVAVQLASIFDLTAKEVCGSCPLWSQCWKQKDSETFRAFCTATPAMQKRGMALKEDFPEGFIAYCLDFPRILSHLNTSLESVSGRKQHQNRLQESRQAVGEQYEFLAAYCNQIEEQIGAETFEIAAFYPEISLKTLQKQGNDVSGDRCGAFHCGETFYCVLLCDGMGTGQDAAEEGNLAIASLKGLLQAGLPPVYALHLLNNFYVLRGNGCFSTVDLLWIDLALGDATLYKWGTAPSYWKGETTQKLGAVTPPPGLGVGEKHQAQTVALTMERGQTVVLLSDGIDGGAMERLIGGWRACPPRELTSAILAEAKSLGDDDMTAIAVTLRQRSCDF